MVTSQMSIVRREIIGHNQDRIHGQVKRKESRNLARVPRGISFDGKGDWQAFATKFKMFADGQRWSREDRKSQPCWCLDGAASEFFTNLNKREPTISYYDLMERLERRYDVKELP